jgi:iron complex outermembrane recepter protein
MRTRTVRIAAKTFLVPLTLAAPAQAWASEPVDATIIVTATRQPLPVVAVPASLAVLPRARLDAASVRAFADLAQAEPSLQISAYQGESQVFVRGIGAVTFLGGFDSSVAVNLDGVYLGRPAAFAPAFFDVERVEVLKGPQGTLYGRNATGGAINIVTRAPTRTWQGDARVVVGNYGRADVRAGVSGPLGDRVSIRLAVGAGNHTGYTRVLRAPGAQGVPGRTEDQHDQQARLRLDWQALPGLRLTLSGDVYRADDRAVVFNVAGPGYANNPLFLARVGSGIMAPPGTRAIASSIRPYNRPVSGGVMARADADLGKGATLTASVAWRATHPRNYNDMSNSTVLAETQFKEENARQWSGDLMLRTAPDAPWRGMIGYSHYAERNRVRNEFFIPYLAAYLGGAGREDCCVLRANGSQHTRSDAVFAELGHTIGDATTVTLGGRWSHERREGRNLLDFTGLQRLNDAALGPATFAAFTPRALVERKLGGTALIYASVTRGYKAGGFNLGSTQNTAYAPELIWSWEGGVKLHGPGWTLSASGFHYDYTDLQVQDVDANSVLIRNAASARVDGAEINVDAAITPRTRLGASATWLDARFSRYRTINTKQPALGVQDLSGNPLPQAPHWRLVAHAEQDLALGGGTLLRLRGDASWQDRIWFSAFRDPRDTQPAFWWLKARATLLPAGARWQAALFVDNLTDARVFTNISITGDLDASRALGNMAPPRTFGLELERRF